jgi:PhzF family phenazine biosynthesis protein
MLPEAEWMQQVAREMNLAESAFLYRQEDGFNWRWFTPTVEMDLCGHATLASAHILWEEGYLRPDELTRFHTRSGLLTATREGSWIELDFPAAPMTAAYAPQELVEALGVASTAVGTVGKVQEDYLLEVVSEATVHAIRPDLLRLEQAPARVVTVTARSDSPAYDFVVRVFDPREGIRDDPVTGSVQCTLAPTGASTSASGRSSLTRRRPVVGCCGCAWTASGAPSGGRPLRYCAVNSSPEPCA